MSNIPPSPLDEDTGRRQPTGAGAPPMDNAIQGQAPAPALSSEQAASERLAGSNQRLLDVIFEMLDSQPDAQGELADAPGFAGGQPWVLCVDDDPEFSLLLKLRLETLGVGVKRVAEGMAGLRAAAARPADAILLDYQMPGGQGDYVLRRLKANPTTRDIPVIVITGHKDERLKRRMLDLGAAQFITKPPDMAELTKVLNDQLRDRLPRRRAAANRRRAASGRS